MTMIGVGNVATVSNADIYEAWENRQNGIPFTDAQARTVAMYWQSSGTIGSVLASFASGADVDMNDMFDDIARTRKAYFDSKKDMDLLLWWVQNRESARTGRLSW